MARIRTIKPEFQNSQSMGRVSRDARLTFIELWPQCDDAGRIRANSRMLASVLFPYDEDAPKLIDEWLSELENEGCIVRYTHDKDEYLAICHWDHQKIDHPQPSKLPPPKEKKRAKTKLSLREQVENDLERSANIRAVSSTVPYQGPYQGPGEDSPSLRSEPVHEVDELSAIEAYNSAAEELGWSKAQRLTPKRKASLNRRLSECGGITGWLGAMAKARASPFLRGETGRTNGHEDWKPDLDFFLQESSFTKLMEGKYDGSGRPKNTKRNAHDAFASAARSIIDEIDGRSSESSFDNDRSDPAGIALLAP